MIEYAARLENLKAWMVVHPLRSQAIDVGVETAAIIGAERERACIVDFLRDREGSIPAACALIEAGQYWRKP